MPWTLRPCELGSGIQWTLKRPNGLQISEFDARASLAACSQCAWPLRRLRRGRILGASSRQALQMIPLFISQLGHEAC